MSTTTVYEELRAEVDDELRLEVLQVLLDSAGQRVTRGELVLRVFGKYVNERELAASIEDRKIRDCIEWLRTQRDFPIMSSSGEAGYMLAVDESEVDNFIREQYSRARKAYQNAEAAQRARRRIPDIRRWAEGKPSAQMRLF